MRTARFDSEEFVQRLKAYDSKAVSEIVRAFNRDLLKFALSHKLTTDMAEELLQETWNEFFGSIERFERRSKLKTFITGILYNKIREQFRKQKRFVSTNDETYDYFMDQPGLWSSETVETPEDHVTRQEYIMEVQSALDELPENQRTAFFMREVEGRSTEEICDIMDITASNLGVLVYRAKNTLRQRLESLDDNGKLLGILVGATA